MIEKIIIKNAIIFPEINLELQPGLNVFSGASGSGKSVFMQSLLAAFGLKDSNAEFQSTLLSAIPINTQEYGIEYEENEEIILNIQKKEKTRFFFNSNPISKKTLQAILSPFIKHISLKNATELEEQNILHILDLSIKGEHQENLKKFKTKFQELRQIELDLKELLEQEKQITELKEFTAFEIQKIESINPKIGEYEELLNLKKHLSKKEKLTTLILKALECFNSFQTIQQALNALNLDSQSLDNELSDTQAKLENELEKLQNLEEINPEEILDRISSLSDLNNRYGSIENALSHLQKERIKLQEYHNISFNKVALQEKQAALKQECLELATNLHKERLKYQNDFKNKIHTLCSSLKLKSPILSLEKGELKSDGYTYLDLNLANTQISNLSTGEYNRLRLIMMCLESEFSPKTGVLILDEIDANLSGEESDGVAQVLKTLSKNYQIFAISHQPHIPALADAHYLVSKNDKHSQITLLDNNGKIYEIARMISGSKITKEALEFAKTRLGLSSEY